MALDIKSSIGLRVEVTERNTDTGVAEASGILRHVLDFALAMAHGTDASQSDRVWSGDVSVESGTPQDLDVRGGTVSKLTGQAIIFAELTWIFIVHTGTTAGQTLTIGAGSNPITTIWGASGDASVIGPGGLFVWGSPIDGAATTAATADILRLVASTGTVDAQVILIGRSA